MAFIFKITTTASPQTFTIPCKNIGVFNATIDWGDGGATSTITSYNDADLVHSYTTAGQYTITITGTFTNIYFNNSGDKLLVDEVVDLGDVGWLRLSRSFYGCSNMTSFLAPTANTSAVTTMSYMFYDTTATVIDVSGFDTSAVTNMYGMFRNSAATVIDVSGFNTSAVTNMSNMFYNTVATTIDTSGFDTSAATNMSYMFYKSKTTTIDVSGFNTSLVISMVSMFYETAATVIDVSGFDTSAVTGMSYMFYGTEATVIDVSGFDTSAVTTMSYMFYKSKAAVIDASSFDTSAVTSMHSMFRNSAATTIDVSSFDTSAVTDMRLMFSSSAATTIDVSGFNTSLVTNMYYMFYKSKAAVIDASSFDTSAVTSMSNMFRESVATTIDVSSFNTSSVTDMRLMFYNTAATVIDVSGFDTSAVTSMYGMFNKSKAAVIDVSGFDTSTVTDMSNMFRESVATTIDTSGFDTSAVTTLSYMFYKSKTTTINVSGFNTSLVTSMASMFNLTLATVIDVSGFDTSAVTTMSYMFYKSKATDLAIDGWDISNVTNMSNFLTGVALPISRYDSTLIAWSKQSVHPGITINFGNSKYSSKVEKDRSAKGKDATPYGTVVKAPVDAGSELMAYSGFSSSNYIKQEYNSDLDFGTSDFFIGSWVKGSASLSTATIFARTTSTTSGIHFYKDTSTSGAKLVVRLGNNIIEAVTGGITDNAWHFVAVSRSGSTVTLWQDGIDVLNPTGTPGVYSLDVSDNSPVVTIGFSLIEPLAQSLEGISLLRVGITAPTAVQVLKIYNDELPLFQPKAAATIAGTSDSVTDISVDNDTTKLHVGTSFGRSVFNGLEREYNLVNPVAKVIDASGGLILDK